MRVLGVCGVLVAAFVLAGCSDSSSAPGTATATDALIDPSVCDASRPAVAHGPDGEPRIATLTIVPCVSKTGYVSREPTIGITSSGTVFHYPAMSGDNTEPTGVAVSTDRGKTWRQVLPTEQGVPSHPTSVDPYLYVDPWTDRVFADDLADPFCSYGSWTDDEGETWDNTVAGCLEADHQTIFAGPPVTSSPTGYANVVYRCAINAVMLGGTGTMSTCQKSTDGGRTWLPFQEPAFTQDPDKLPEVCGGAHGHGIADAKGTIYLPKGHCGVPMIAISDDEGATWRRVATSTTVGTNDHEVGVGIDPNGTIYASWSGPDGLPYLAHSMDAGATWSEPLMVAAPGVVDTGFTELYVGGVGKVALVYYGTHQQPGDPARTYEAYMTLSYDALDASPTFYSAAFNDPTVDAFVVGSCCGGVQDFIDVRIGPDGTPWAAFIDDCLGPGTQCSTREIAPGVEEQLDTQREGVGAWLEGAPSLWDASDPNGPYP